MNNLTSMARQVFANDRYATALTGIQIDGVDIHEAHCSLTLSQDHRNAKNAVMGGVMFTLADFAFAIAANSDILNSATSADMVALAWVSTSSTINFLRPASGDKLFASASCVRHGKTQAVYQILISDNTNRAVALVTTTGSRVLV